MARNAVPLPREVREPDGWDRPVWHAVAHVLFTDGSWRWARVTNWRRARGQWFVHLTWPDRRSSWRVHDLRYIHPA